MLLAESDGFEGCDFDDITAIFLGPAASLNTDLFAEELIKGDSRRGFEVCKNFSGGAHQNPSSCLPICALHNACADKAILGASWFDDLGGRGGA